MREFSTQILGAKLYYVKLGALAIDSTIRRHSLVWNMLADVG